MPDVHAHAGPGPGSSSASGQASTPGLRFESQARSHPGRRRTVNEDRLLDRSEAGLWAVADGMGGLRAGDVAATRLIEGLAAVGPGTSGYARLSDILSEVEQVNARLFAGQGEAAGGSLSGSTLVALLVHERHYACLWAGDSRGYLLRDGRLLAITHDHSVVQQLVDDGRLADSQRRSHPSAHVITRAVGTGPTVEVDQRFGPIFAGDVFLLCSDGLTSCVDDVEIAAMLERAELAEAADRLLSTALDRQAADNVSFVAIRAGEQLAAP